MFPYTELDKATNAEFRFQENKKCRKIQDQIQFLYSKLSSFSDPFPPRLLLSVRGLTTIKMPLLGLNPGYFDVKGDGGEGVSGATGWHFLKQLIIVFKKVQIDMVYLLFGVDIRIFYY